MIVKSEQSTMFFMHNDSIYNNAVFDFGRNSSLVHNVAVPNYQEILANQLQTQLDESSQRSNSKLK